MKIGTRLPGFAGQIGFEAFAEWLADSGFDAVDTPVLTRQHVHAAVFFSGVVERDPGGGQLF